MSRHGVYRDLREGGASRHRALQLAYGLWWWWAPPGWWRELDRPLQRFALVLLAWTCIVAIALAVLAVAMIVAVIT